MSDSTDVAGASDAQDGWLHATLGLDVSGYVAKAEGAVSDAVDTVENTATTVKDDVKAAVTDTVATVEDTGLAVEKDVTDTAKGVVATVDDGASRRWTR